MWTDQEAAAFEDDAPAELDEELDDEEAEEDEELDEDEESEAASAAAETENTETRSGR